MQAPIHLRSHRWLAGLERLSRQFGQYFCLIASINSLLISPSFPAFSASANTLYISKVVSAPQDAAARNRLWRLQWPARLPQLSLERTLRNRKFIGLFLEGFDGFGDFSFALSNSIEIGHVDHMRHLEERHKGIYTPKGEPTKHFIEGVNDFSLCPKILATPIII